ncbi:MAG TPA: AAA family ATPase [Candidatus Limnocylindrales bacterium]|nr:AAA family ATPase [Candidatus Limnocylindrales bacterium]
MTRRVSSPVFVGRREELRQIKAAVDRVDTGEWSIVVVAGEAGAGKSRLVAEIAAWSVERGVRVLVGHAVELGDVGLPFAAVSEAVRQLTPRELDMLAAAERRELARLVPGLASTHPAPVALHDEPAAIQAAFYEHLRAALARISRERPVLLVLEDLHWADGSTRDLLRYLARNLDAVRVTLLLTYRSDDLHRRHPLGHVLADLDRLGAERITLPPFDDEEVAAQAEGILGHPVDRIAAARIRARADGNAFFVEEIIAAGAEDNSPVPETVGEVVSSRIARLDETTHAVLRVAAVVGRRVGHDLLQRLVDVDEAGLLAAIRQAVDEHLLLAEEEAGEIGYVFRHALVQETLAVELLPTERVHLHRRIAQLLTAEDVVGMEPEIAYHWLRAHDLPEALQAAVRAAAAASNLAAFREALAQYETALELWPSVPDAASRTRGDHAALLVRAADAAASSGALVRAIGLSDDAAAELAGADPARELEAIHRSVHARWILGQSASAEAIARRAIANASPDSPPRVRARLLADLAAVDWDARRYLDGLRSSRRAVRFADRSGDRVERARSRVALALVLGELGRPAEALAAVREAIVLLEGGPLDLRLHAGVALTHILDMAGLAPDALEAAPAELDLARDAGLIDQWGPTILANYVDALFETGDFDTAEALRAERTHRGDPSQAWAWLAENAVEVAVQRDELAAANEYLELARTATGTPGQTNALWLEYCEASVALAEGRLMDARTLLDRAIGRSLTAPHDSVLRFPLERGLEVDATMADRASSAGDAAAVADARAHGMALIEMLERFLAAADPAGWEAPLELFRRRTEAQRLRLAGRPDAAAWAGVADAALGLRRLPEAGDALVREAEAAIGAGDRDRAAGALDRAAEIAASTGGHALARAVDTVRRSARLPRTPAPPAAGLSGRELEVLALVAAGHTNREIGDRLFISEKTASVHVTHILDKLGVRSRTEAALVGAQRGLLARGAPGGETATAAPGAIR